MCLLPELNKRKFTRIHGLEEATSLPSSAIMRILENSNGLGYVEKEAHSVGYKLTVNVQELSIGYSDMPEILDPIPPNFAASDQRNALPGCTGKL